MARKNYRSHIIRAKGWKNECVGYHIKGDIFDAAVAKSIVEIEGEQCCLMQCSRCISKEFSYIY